MFSTMSISCAPASIAASVSNRLASASIAPSGKPTTVTTLIGLSSSRARSLIDAATIHADAVETKLRASAQSCSMSFAVASAFSKV